jgi:hypothetical protein
MSGSIRNCSPLKRTMFMALGVTLAGTAAFGALHHWLHRPGNGSLSTREDAHDL